MPGICAVRCHWKTTGRPGMTNVMGCCLCAFNCQVCNAGKEPNRQKNSNKHITAIPLEVKNFFHPAPECRVVRSYRSHTGIMGSSRNGARFPLFLNDDMMMMRI